MNIEENCVIFKYNTSKEFIDEILWGNEISVFLKEKFIYRGESTSKYQLIPSALRECNKQKLWEQAGYEYINNEHNDKEYKQVSAEYYALRNFF